IPRKSYGVAAARARANGMRSTPANPDSMYVLAASAITFVASVSAGPPLGGLYLNPPSLGGLCDRRRGCVAIPVVDEHGHVIGYEDLERGHPVWFGQPMGVTPQEQWAVVALCPAVVADRLGGRQDVRFVERVPQAAASVSGGAEGHALVGIRGVRRARVIGRDKVGDIYEVRR